MFDIDWMAGMSAGVFTLQNADVKTVSQELDKVIGDRDTSPLTGILRIIPIERMNALLVISPNPEYIEQAKKWIERLDSGSGEGARFYVYNLQNQRAEHVGAAAAAGVHRPHDAADGAGAADRRARHAGGTIVSPPSFQTQPTITPNTPRHRPRRRPRPPQARPSALRRARDARSAAKASASCATSRSSPTRTRTRADRRDAVRVLDHRAGAEEARRRRRGR